MNIAVHKGIYYVESGQGLQAWKEKFRVLILAVGHTELRSLQRHQRPFRAGSLGVYVGLVTTNNGVFWHICG